MQQKRDYVITTARTYACHRSFHHCFLCLCPAMGTFTLRLILSLEIRIRLFQVQFLDPSVAVAHIVAFALELRASGRVSNAFAAVSSRAQGSFAGFLERAPDGYLV